MNSYISSLDKAKAYLEQLSIDEQTNALWDILHLAVWHKGIDWVRWINDNNNLIEKIIIFGNISKVPDELKKEIWASINKLKEIDR